MKYTEKTENAEILFNCQGQGEYHRKWLNMSQIVKSKWYLDADWKSEKALLQRK